jgi:hypothetical protein
VTEHSVAHGTFRVGGRESSSGDVHGSTYSFEVTDQDIVPLNGVLYAVHSPA